MVPDFSHRAYFLDSLRGVCCLFVIMHHWKLGPIPRPVSGTGGSLIQEGKDLNVYQFLVKRSLHIYPLHYIFIFTAATVDCIVYGPSSVTRQQIFGEMFYLQNFVGKLQGHTWTLAVEEHFYVLLPLALLASGSKFPRVCISVIALVSFVCTFQSLVWGFSAATRVSPHYKETYFCIDGLFIGALLAWHKHYSPDLFECSQGRHAFRFCLGALALVTSAALTGLDPIFSRAIIGYLMNSVSSAVVVASLTELHVEPKSWTYYLFYPLSFIGFYLYAVYLFHNFFVKWVMYAVTVGAVSDPATGFALCIACAVFTGWAMSELIDPVSHRARKHLLANPQPPVGEDYDKNLDSQLAQLVTVPGHV
eukprot:3940442-Rhodomonas_salina.1